MTIHPNAIVEKGAKIGAGVEIGPFAFIGANVTLADGVKVHSHAVVTGITDIGAGTVVHSHAVLGGGPQVRGDKGEGARLTIGADNVIREHVTMSCGSTKGGGHTTVGSRGYFMAYSHVAHDCHIGDNVTFANGAQLGGHVEVGDGANLGGLCAVQQFSRIGKGAFIGGVTGVPDDVIPYGMAVGDRARLLGLNLIGLKRKGLSRAQIHTMRAAFRAIFFGKDRLADRAAAAGKRWKDSPEVAEIVEFILADSKRPICTPRSALSAESED
jgi:UDP-N-acetylglucosamine acyltransferase